MKKTNSLKKITTRFLIHAIEFVLFYFVAVWIQAVAPVGYVWPAIVLIGLVYLVYLASTLVDDYLDMQGADFMI